MCSALLESYEPGAAIKKSIFSANESSLHVTTGMSGQYALGKFVGDSVGDPVGDALGMVDGDAVGKALGLSEGTGVGDPDGTGVGETVGTPVGKLLGTADGEGVGAALGLSEGAGVGTALGLSEGTGVGDAVGTGVGPAVGATDGTGVGDSVGDTVGTGVGDTVGDRVAPKEQHCKSVGALAQLAASDRHVATQHTAGALADLSSLAVKGRSASGSMNSSPSTTVLARDRARAPRSRRPEDGHSTVQVKPCNVCAPLAGS